MSRIVVKIVKGDTFTAIVVPQNLERRTPLVEITMGGIAYLLDYSISFRTGNYYDLACESVLKLSAFILLY